MTDQRYSFFYAGDAFPAVSSPFLSGYPGPSPLTSDPSYRSANSSSLQMAQLWASHAHDGKPPYASANTFISHSLSVSGACLISSKTQAALYFYLSQRAPVQSPGGLFLSFSLLPPMASCSISVPLLLAVLLALSYMHLIFPVLHLSSTHPCHTLL